MPRKRLSEFRSKTIVAKALDLPYIGWSVDAEANIAQQLATLVDGERYVLKVDQGVKGRFKKGLVKLDVGLADLPVAIGDMSRLGYRWFIVEPQVFHQSTDERYMSIGHTLDGLHLTYSRDGGVDIESNVASIEHITIDADIYWPRLANVTGFSEDQLKRLVELYTANYGTLLEINPYIVELEGIRLLDLAIEVDDAAELMVRDWSAEDFRSSSYTYPEVRTVEELAAKSPASFKLDVINPEGSVFLLLSGGGASITIADEIFAKGFGKQLANYGEYSGNPNHEEAYIYTLAVLDLLLKSKADKKVVIVGGAVANFTDIANTFGGLIQAFEERAEALQKQQVKVFVRRGGPRQEIGLARIRDALQRLDILGAVHGPSTPLTAVVGEALEQL